MEYSERSEAAEGRERVRAAAGCGGGLDEHSGIPARLCRTEDHRRTEQRESHREQWHGDWSEHRTDPEFRLVWLDCEAAVCGAALYIRPRGAELGMVDPHIDSGPEPGDVADAHHHDEVRAEDAEDSAGDAADQGEVQEVQGHGSAAPGHEQGDHGAAEAGGRQHVWRLPADAPPVPIAV